MVAYSSIIVTNVSGDIGSVLCHYLCTGQVCLQTWAAEHAGFSMCKHCTLSALRTDSEINTLDKKRMV